MDMTTRCTSDGKRISLLGYGSMRMPTLDGGHANGWVTQGYSTAGIDQEELNRQIRYLLDHGVNYFDTSPAYCRGESEGRLGKALAASGYARKDYVLATKLSNFTPDQYPLDACKKMFARSLAELRTDYIDNYLLHAIGNGGFETFSKRYLENGALDWCATLRQKGLIRNLGFSFHGDAKAFEWCLAHHAEYKWDFCQIQMNYVDWRHAKEVNERNLNAEYLYDVLTDKGIPIVVMEPLLGGALARYNYALASTLKPLDPEASLARWAFRFFANRPNVMTVLSGMTRFSDIEENVATFSPLRPCDEREQEALERAAVAYLKLRTVPCTGCKYCMPCPRGVDIPAVFAFRNEVLSSETMRTPAELQALYRERVPEASARADRCVRCGLCQKHCPQHIDIPGELATIDKWVGGAAVETERTPEPEPPKAAEVRKVPCLACGNCLTKCPYGIDIQALLAFVNEIASAGEAVDPADALARYERCVAEARRRADRCVGCGRCLASCPKGIDIPEELAKLDAQVAEWRSVVFCRDIERRNKEAKKWF